MKPLSEWTLLELARHWPTTERIDTELERRQAMLDAADRLYEALRSDGETTPAEAMAAYAAARGI